MFKQLSFLLRNLLLESLDKKAREVSELFKDAETNFDVKQLYPSDKSGKSYAVSDGFFLENGSIGIRCTDWSDEISKKYNKCLRKPLICLEKS